MGIPIGELQERVTSREFAEYWAFHQLSPIGPERDDLRAGVVASTIANANRNPKKRRRPYTAAELMPQFATPELDAEELDEEELDAKIERAMEALGGGPVTPETA
jgi:hypothetical protein